MPSPDRTPPAGTGRAGGHAPRPAPLPQAALDDAQRLACLRLIRSENIGPVTFRELINHYGGATAALEALPALTARSGSGRKLRICPRDRAEAELAAARRAGAVPVFTIEPGYPSALAHVEMPPPLLYVRGDAELLSRPAIAIVGSRDASAAGMTLTRQFAVELGNAGLVVVSGLARGIDAAAHDASLATGTVAVLAGGIDVIYPPENTALYHRIVERGVVVAEMPPGFQPRGQEFPRRNRIISGIARGVLVIEAARRSGTLITARLAGEQGREVFAVPGHPLDPRAEGTNDLLRKGATLATRASDIIEALRPQIEEAPPPRPGIAEHSVPAPVPPPPLPAGDQFAAVVAALGPAPMPIDALTRTTGLPARSVQAILLELDLAGRIERHGGQLVSLRG